MKFSPILSHTIDASSETQTDATKSLNFVRNGRVYILGDFDDTISRCVVPDLVELISEGAESKDCTIPIYINSFGGEADKLQSILTLLDVARAADIKIVTYNIGVAYSCGSLLAVSGDVRFMASGARNLMHLGSIGSVNATYEQLKRNEKDAREFFDETVKMYVRRTKMTEQKIREILNDDCYFMNAKECLKAGLCDKII